jgi:hypothetical protein
MRRRVALTHAQAGARCWLTRSATVAATFRESRHDNNYAVRMSRYVQQLPRGEACGFGYAAWEGRGQALPSRTRISRTYLRSLRHFDGRLTAFIVGMDRFPANTVVGADLGLRCMRIVIAREPVRLLDLVAQSNATASGLPAEWQLPCAHHFAAQVRACPLRLVLEEDLIQVTTQLAYAEGERLSSCLDLVRVPAQHLWVEWLEERRQSTLREIPACSVTSPSTAKRAGALIYAHPNGRTGTMRTFWSTSDEQVHSAAVLTSFDLDRAVRPQLDIAAVFSGAAFGVVVPEEEALDELLCHVSFRLDPAWVNYYRDAGLTDGQRMLVLREVLGTTAFDMPMILALFLLFAAKDGVRHRAANLERLNRIRRISGKPPLLEHIEARAAIAAGDPDQTGPSLMAGTCSRRGPRLHHVRGHIARRGDKVFWRLPHLRGNARLGMVRSRTVQLSFH